MNLGCIGLSLVYFGFSLHVVEFVQKFVSCVCAKNLPKGASANLLCVLTMFPVPEKEKKTYEHTPCMGSQ